MDTEKLRHVEKAYRLPEGLLQAIIEIEEAHQYQVKPRGVIADIEQLLRDFSTQQKE